MGSNRPRMDRANPGQILVTADSRCRLSLFHLGVEPGDLFTALAQDDGCLILTPVQVIPRESK